MAEHWRPEPAEDVLWLHDVALSGADFSGRRLRTFSVARSSLVRCDFRRIRATGCGLGGGNQPTEYIECNFDGVRLKNVLPGRASFVSCSFRDVRIEDMFCHETQFIDCVFTGKLRSVVFNGQVSEPDEHLGRTINEYRGNDFSHVEFDDVAFRTGIDLDEQRLPEGPAYLLIRNAAEAIAEARAEIRRLSDEADFSHLELVLSVLEDDAENGQRDIHIERAFLMEKVPAAYVERFVTILTG